MSAGTRAPGRKMNPVIVAENRHSRAGDYHNSQRQPGRLRVQQQHCQPYKKPWHNIGLKPLHNNTGV
jgi:hypothetical protein